MDNTEDNKENVPNENDKKSRDKLVDLVTILRKLPPTHLSNNINGLSDLVYEDDEVFTKFIQIVDAPCEVVRDNNDLKFLGGEFNRDGDSWRSPFNNKYYPEGEEPCTIFPVPEIRDFELNLNKKFVQYANFYYGPDALIGVFAQKSGEDIKEGVLINILIKNTLEEGDNKSLKGTWDSSTIIKITFPDEQNNTPKKIKANYNITSTIIIGMDIEKKDLGHANLTGTCTKNVNHTAYVEGYLDHHSQIENIGTYFEDVENTMRDNIDEIYCKKSGQIVDSIRNTPVEAKQNDKKNVILSGAFSAENK